MMDLMPLWPPADAQTADRKGNIVKQNEHALGRQLVEPRRVHHGQAGVVHERLRLEQQQLLAACGCLRGQAAEAGAVDLHAELFRQRIDGAEADVVPGAGIVQAGIAQTHNEPAAGGRFGKQHQNRLEIDVSL